MNLTGPKTNKLVWKAACLSALAMILLVFGVRLFYTFDFAQPRFFITSGSEEESLFALWKYVHRQTVYVDFHKMPFAASYFNWGFYLFYGSVIKFSLNVFHLGDEWIATVGRLLTFAGCATGFYFAVKIMQRLVRPVKPGLWQWAMPAFVFAGYIMGFWAITVRPDVWALAFELAGLYFFLQYTDSKNLRLPFAAILCFYLAWSFKQNFVGLFGGCMVYLLSRKRFALALQMVFFFAVLAIGTYFLGSADYRYLLFQSQLKMQMAFSIGLYNFRLGFVKCLPVTLFSLVLAFSILITTPVKKIRSTVWRNDHLLLLVLCFSVSFPFFFFMAMKDGASDNYFFTPFIALALLNGYVLYRRPLSERLPATTAWGFLLACLLTLAQGFLILTERSGRVNLRPLSTTYESAKRLMDTLPKPILFENDNVANLPWINHSPKNFIIATTYYYKDVHGDTLERGGVEGLMRDGYFAAIVNENHPADGWKDRYLLTDSIFEGPQRFYVWRRK